ncbi:DegV family protein [Lentilactobacillus sp. Marseille-Q4993]|uniref:DegV family protein n=1 Tax=Lentilactobacillus sp. Marseille-Q4993 TaxID=3039492 RepID=UPI0024BCD608|nr:DegV family protein [Lentilactobacillus sp. Marseille-Q4993]
MATVKIVTDSSVQLSEDEKSKYDITVIPLSIMIDETVYVDGETISSEQFVKMMLEADNLPKTSQPPIGKFVDAFDKLGADGSQVLCINMMEQLSGSVHAAEQAATLSSADVTVVDSGTTDRGLGFQVVEAAKLAATGASVDEIVERIETVRKNTVMAMGVMTLDNIVKGGRLHPVAGAITNFLNIKIILKIEDHKLKIESKGRGVKFIKKYFDNVISSMSQDKAIKAIGISYVNTTDLISEIADKIKEQVQNVPFLLKVTSPVISTHAGEGAFALFYFDDPE